MKNSIVSYYDLTVEWRSFSSWYFMCFSAQSRCLMRYKSQEAAINPDVCSNKYLLYSLVIFKHLNKMFGHKFGRTSCFLRKWHVCGLFCKILLTMRGCISVHILLYCLITILLFCNFSCFGVFSVTAITDTGTDSDSI